MTDEIDGFFLARPLLFAALAALAFAPLEHLAPARPGRRRSFAVDLGFATLGQLVVRLGTVLGVGAALARLDEWGLERPLLAGLGPPALRPVLDVGVGLLLFELGGYGYHRLAHRSPLLWRLHEVHHSSERMDWLASFRQHPLEILLLTLAQNAPLVLLGVPLGAHAAVLVLLRVNTILVHANLRVPVGPWRVLVATPRFHHRHHQRHGTACNFASLFPFLDRLFGTYRDESAHDFGLPQPLPEDLLGLVLHPLRLTRR